MDLEEVFSSLGIALGLGLLVGLQRERAHAHLAGFRTFALVTVLGAVCAIMAATLGGWVVAAGLFGVVAAMVVGNVALMRAGVGVGEQDGDGRTDYGITTEVALILMYTVGAFVVSGARSAAVAVGVGVAVLLQEKERLHGLARRLGEKDIRAIMLFAAITFIVLPVVPDRTLGPYNVLNPHNIWLMVVLVVGISLGGYVAYKFFGGKRGLLVAGLLGGAISSTATTVSYAKRASESPAYCLSATLVITLASAVVYVRLYTEIGVVAPSFLASAAGPLAVLLGLTVAMAMVLWLIARHEKSQLPEQQNPTELKSAVMFALLYAAVVIAVAAAKEHLGDKGLYLVAAVSGLTDMDAITLSTSRLVAAGDVGPSAGWRAIIIAAASNNLFKAGMVGSLGGRRLLAMMLPVFAVKISAAVLLVMFWPA